MHGPSSRQFPSANAQGTLPPHRPDHSYSRIAFSVAQPRKFSTFKDPCDYIGSTFITQGPLPTSSFLTLIASKTFLLPGNVTLSRLQEIRTCPPMGTYWSSAYHSI